MWVDSISKWCKIYALEPDTDNFKRLKEHIHINKLQNQVICFNKGVQWKKGRKNLFLYWQSAWHSFVENTNIKARNQITIDCITLEDIFNENKISYCDILKIDVEWSEYDIFYNTPNSIFHKIWEIRMEYHDLNEKYNWKNLAKFLKSKGFVITKLSTWIVLCKNTYKK